jgi:FtsZ-interacting cell division protein ZipA
MESIIVGILSLVGVIVSNLIINSKNNAVMYDKIETLEKKVEKHNSMVERMYKAEGAITELQHDVRDLKGGTK